jgi:formate hydrogenlyase subunit 3/multisubunit Na+/H+ antiporter MnhD subunit
VDATARSGRIALALPFITDLFLLCGIAVLYSRYGKQNLANLVPILHSPGWTVRQLVVASILLFVGVAGRMALWPLQSWVTASVTTAPAAASAIVQACWPVVAVTVLYHVLPVFTASSPQAVRDILIACGVAAVAGPVLSLFAIEPRRAVTLAGTGVVAIGAAITIRGFEYQGFTFAVAGAACVLAVSPARAAAVLAATAVSSAMRSDDMRDQADAWRRMRASSLVLLGVAIAFGVSSIAAMALAVDSRSRFGLILGEALFLAIAGAMRVFMSLSFGPLRRRRAFDPDRVRDAPTAALGWPYWLVVISLAVGVASLVTGWLGFLDYGTHRSAKAAAYAVWTFIAVLGVAAPALSLSWNKEGALRASAWVATSLQALLLRTSAAIDRFLLEPSARIADRTADALFAGDGAIARISVASGVIASASSRAPALPVLVVMTVLLALLLGLLSPVILR